MTSLLQVVLLGAAPLLEIDEANSTSILGWLLCAAVLGPFLAGLAAICYSVWRHFQPSNVFGMFLCHHKGGAGSLCRLIKLLIARHRLRVSTISASVVVVLSPELLKRMWCALPAVLHGSANNTGSSSKVKARILITGSVTDAEAPLHHMASSHQLSRARCQALATLEVFQILVQNHLRVECAMVRSSQVAEGW
eukprot:Skav224431  [mRNA]  locus=scaffold3233:1754:11275:+ [translate_table: standard]